MSDSFWTIAIGASIGNQQSLVDLISELPADFPATILFGWKFDSTTKPANLTEVFKNNANIKVLPVAHSTAVECGAIYIPAPGGHIELEENYAQFYRRAWMDHGPREVSQLLSSVADQTSGKCMGVLLSGLGQDGISGLEAVEASGGLCLVETPNPKVDAHSTLKPDFQGSAEGIGKYMSRILQGESC